MTSQKSDFQRYAWFLFVLLTACYGLVSFFRTSTSTLAVDIMADFAVGGGLMSLMSSAYFYPYGLMQIPAGILADRWGSRKTITFFMILGAAGAVLFAMASSAGVATVGRVIIGMGMGMVFVPALRVFLRWFPQRQHVFITGLLLSLGTGGMLLATWPLGKLAQAIGWRGSMLLSAAVTLVMSLAVWIWTRNSPEEKFPSLVGEGKTRKQVEDRAAAHRPLGEVVLSVVRRPAYWGISIWFFCMYGSFFAMTSLWSGPYFIQGYGMSKDAAGVVLLTMALGAVIGPALVGFIAQRGFSKRRMLTVSCLMSIILGVPLILSKPVLPFLLLPWWSMLFGIFCGGFGSVALGTVQEEFPAEIVGTATGMINIYCYIGTALLQLASGWIMELQAPGQSVYSLDQYAVMFLLFMAMFCCAFLAVCVCLRHGNTSRAYTIVKE